MLHQAYRPQAVRQTFGVLTRMNTSQTRRRDTLQSGAADPVRAEADGVPVAQPLMPPLSAIAPYIAQIDARRWYTNFGPLLLALEARLAMRFAAPATVVTAANGTQVLTLALQAMNLPAGALCALPAWTFVATAHAVLAAGLVPWFVDVDPGSGALDPAHLLRRLAAAPRAVAAVIPVAQFGRPFDFAPWLDFQAETGLPVLVDAAASFDTLDRAPLPTMISLHATKLVSTGEGGLLISEDGDLVARVRKMTNFGFWGSREAQVTGGNFKLSEYAAAVGLASLDEWPVRRRAFAQAAQLLRAGLVGAPWVRFQPGWGVDWVSSTCCVRIEGRRAAEVEQRLADLGVSTRRWWGDGCHVQPAFRHLPADPLPATESLARETLGLPYFSDLSMDDINRICAAVLSVS